MQQTRKRKSHTRADTTAPTYRINRPPRHSPIRRYAGYGIVR